MSNIIVFPTKKITTASRGESTICQIIKKARQYAALPAWIVVSPTLRCAARALQDAAWGVTHHYAHGTLFIHPVTGQTMPLLEAVRAQRDLEWRTA